MSAADPIVAAQLERVAVALEGVQKALELIATQSKCRSDVNAPPSDDPAQLLTADEVAKLLRVNVRTLRLMRHERSFPRPITVGRSLRWRRRTVERFLAEGEK